MNKPICPHILLGVRHEDQAHGERDYVVKCFHCQEELAYYDHKAVTEILVSTHRLDKILTTNRLQRHINNQKQHEQSQSTPQKPAEVGGVPGKAVEQDKVHNGSPQRTDDKPAHEVKVEPGEKKEPSGN